MPKRVIHAPVIRELTGQLFNDARGDYNTGIRTRCPHPSPRNPNMSLRRLILAALIAFGGAVPAGAEDREYPKVNTTTDYVVDPAWPKKPRNFQWGHVPGIAVDARDQVYVFTRAKPPIQVYAADGTLIRSWGDDIKEAHHLKIDGDGNIWITDIGRHVVEKYTPEGRRLLSVGTPGEAGKDRAHLNMPTDVAVAPSGDFFVSDGYGNDRVVHFSKDGKFVHEWGQLGSGRGQFSIPHAIGMDSKGRLYVADRNNVRIVVYDQTGRQLDEWKDVITPWGFWVTKDDEIWVCGSSPMQWRPEDKVLGCPPKDQVVMKFNTQGKVLQVFTIPKGNDGMEKPGDVNWLHCLAFDSKGNLYLGDIIGKRAQKFVAKPPHPPK